MLQYFPWHLSFFPHVVKGPGLLFSPCGPWGRDAQAEMSMCLNQLAQVPTAPGAPQLLCVLIAESPCSALRAAACPHLSGTPLWMTKVVNLHTQLEVSASPPERPDPTLSSLLTEWAHLEAPDLLQLCTDTSVPFPVEWKGDLLPLSLETLCPTVWESCNPLSSCQTFARGNKCWRYLLF